MKRKVLLTLNILLIITFSIGCSLIQGNNGQEPIKLVPISVLNPEESEIQKYENFFGKVEASEDIQIISKISGLVEEVHINPGDEVTKDQLLIEIDDENVRYSLEQAEESYQSALYNLEQAKQSQETSLLNAKNNLELAEDSYTNAKESYENNLKLYEDDIITESQLKQAKSAYIQAENNLEMARDAVEKASSSANIKALEAQVRQAKIGMDQARSSLEDTKIYSPIDGQVAVVNAKEGEMAPMQSPITEIINQEKITIELNVNESSIVWFEEGKEVGIYIPSLEENFIGKVSYVSPAANKQNLTFPVKVEADNNNLAIKSGMLAEVKIRTSDNVKYLRIPSEAVFGTEQNNYVFVYNDGIAEKRTVIVKEMSTEYTYIESGLNVEDLVITRGQHTLTDGTVVEMVEEEGNTQ